jgi:ubiquinone/menaquinone biosynthesis C-methylase UbiE
VAQVARFSQWRDKELLEIGVGAGADHLGFARAGARTHGVDLTAAAITTTRAHLAVHGLTSDLRRCDAEALPFDDQSFDIVYSWGVIHHSDSPARVVAEIHRVLRPGGLFLGMVYARYSLVAAKVWLRYALATGRPFQSLSKVVADHMESQGTKSYTQQEVRDLFSAFTSCLTRKIATHWDTRHLPAQVRGVIPNAAGWFIVIEAVK